MLITPRGRAYTSLHVTEGDVIIIIIIALILATVAL